MRRPVLSLVALVVVGLSSARIEAQQSQESSRPATLTQRLEQFRQDLLGDDSKAQPTKPANNQPYSYRSQDATRAGSALSGNRTAPAATPAPAKSPTPATPMKSAVASTPKPAAAAGATRAAATSPSYSSPAAAATPLQSSRRTSQSDYRTARSEPTPALASEMGQSVPTKAAKPSLQDRLSTARESAVGASDAEESIDEASDRPQPTAAKRADATLAPSGPSKKPAVGSSLPSAPSIGGDNVLFTAQSPQLAVTASGPRKVLIGKESVFVVTVGNAGEVAASNVVVSVNIPAFVEVVAAEPSNGDTHASAGADRSEPLEWKISKLEARSRETLTLKLVPRKSLPIDLAVRWTCSPEVSQTLVDVQEPKLLMALSGPEEVLFGQSKIYKLTISNPGNGDAENVVVSLLPIGRSAESTASHRLGTVHAGESKAIEVELTARQAGSLTIKAVATGDGSLRAEAAETVLVRRANLQVEVLASKVKYAGTVATFRVRLVNAGNATAENVLLAVTLPTEAKYVSSSSGGRLDDKQEHVEWNCGSLQAEAERVFEVQCNLMSPGDNRLQASASADGDLSVVGLATTRVEALADLKLEVRDPQGPVPLGEDAVYEVVIRNRGTKNADGVNLIVFFSEGLEATAVQGGPHDIASGQVTFKPIGSIAAGSESVFRVHARANRDGNHVFRAEVLCQSLGTKLAAEEATHFYGDDSAASEPQEAKAPEPTPARRY